MLDKLRIEAPKKELVDAYLTEIARTYQVDWPPGSQAAREAAASSGVGAAAAEDDDDDDDNPSGGQKIKIAEEAEKPAPEPKTDLASKPKLKESAKGGPGGNVPDADDLSARFAALLRK